MRHSAQQTIKHLKLVVTHVGVFSPHTSMMLLHKVYTAALLAILSTSGLGGGCMLSQRLALTERGMPLGPGQVS